MEKSQYWLETPSYSELQGLNPDNTIEVTGYGFVGGTSVGLLYNLCKFKAGGISRKLLLPNAVRLGGFCALFTFFLDSSVLAMGHLRGTPAKVNVMDEITSLAASAALMWSPRGLRSASLASLVAGGLGATVLHFDRKSYSISKINTYTYPHYRPRKTV